MTTYAYIDVFFEYNSVDLSSHVASLTFSYHADLLDDTAMGDTARSFVGGLKADTFNVNWNQDYAAGAVDATLAAVGVGSAAAFEIRPASGAVSATNPKLTGSAFIQDYDPLSGSVGDLATASTSFVVSGGTTRGTT